MLVVYALGSVAMLISTLAGFLLGKKASTWCPGCGGPSHHPGITR